MARAPDIEGELSTNGDDVQRFADQYRSLQAELTVKRVATKETTGSKTKWRKDCAKSRVNPVLLADAVEMMMKIEKYPKKTTAEWRAFIGYLKKLGFFDKLIPDLLAEFDRQITAPASSDAA